MFFCFPKTITKNWEDGLRNWRIFNFPCGFCTSKGESVVKWNSFVHRIFVFWFTFEQYCWLNIPQLSNPFHRLARYKFPCLRSQKLLNGSNSHCVGSDPSVTYDIIFLSTLLSNFLGRHYSRKTIFYNQTAHSCTSLTNRPLINFTL